MGNWPKKSPPDFAARLASLHTKYVSDLIWVWLAVERAEKRAFSRNDDNRIDELMAAEVRIEDELFQVLDIRTVGDIKQLVPRTKRDRLRAALLHRLIERDYIQEWGDDLDGLETSIGGYLDNVWDEKVSTMIEDPACSTFNGEGATDWMEAHLDWKDAA